MYLHRDRCEIGLDVRTPFSSIDRLVFLFVNSVAHEFLVFWWEIELFLQWHELKGTQFILE